MKIPICSLKLVVESGEHNRFESIRREHFNIIINLCRYGLLRFQAGGTNLERFLPKNKYTQRKLSNFENWVSGEVSKSAKSPNLLTFKVNFLYQK